MRDSIRAGLVDAHDSSDIPLVILHSTHHHDPSTDFHRATPCEPVWLVFAIALTFCSHRGDQEELIIHASMTFNQEQGCSALAIALTSR